MKIKKIILIAVITVIGVFVNYVQAGEWKLSYDSPAAKWRESLPLGNGHLGVTVFGGVSHERLQLSENSIMLQRSPEFGTLKFIYVIA